MAKAKETEATDAKILPLEVTGNEDTNKTVAKINEIIARLNS